MIKILKAFSLMLVLAYAAICAYLYSQQNSMVYYPQVENRDFSKQFEQFEIEFQNGDIRLHGWGNIQNVSPTNPLFIYYYGNGDEASRTIPRLEKMGANNFLVINYRGYGRSTGQPEEQSLKNDALFVFDEVTQQGQIKSDSIVLVGRSLGSGIATYVASERKIAKVILVTPYDSIVNVAQDRFPILPISLLMNQRFESDALAPQIDEPLLCIIAETDRIVPTNHAHRLCDMWKGKMQKVILKGTNHITINKSSEYGRVIKEFVQ